MCALAAAVAVLAGCATMGTTTGPSVGPRAAPSAGTPDTAYQGVRLDVVVPIFDPGLPADPDDYEKEGVWPELRRAEANRFAVALKRALQDTQAFGDVRVSPDTEATGDLYVIGAIEKSDGQDVAIAVEAVDIGGKRWLRKRYRHRVKEHFWRDPRNAGLDPYQPVFDEAAADVARLVGKRSAQELTELRHLAEIRFARSFSEDAFAGYVEERGGRATLAARPDPDDPMLARTRAIRVREGLFLDNMQTHYAAFAQRTDASYAAWQEHSLTEVKARNEARARPWCRGCWARRWRWEARTPPSRATGTTTPVRKWPGSPPPSWAACSSRRASRAAPRARSTPRPCRSSASPSTWRSHRRSSSWRARPRS